MSDETRTYIVAYDVTDDRRRNHVATLLKHCGKRVQYSLFLIETRPAKLITMRAKIDAIIDFKEDSVVYCDIGTRTASEKSLVFTGRRTYRDIQIPNII